MRLIRSAQNRSIREARKLKQRKFRVQRQRFLLEGVRMVSTALKGNAHVAEAFVTAGFVKGPHASELLGRLESTGVEVMQVPEEGLRAVADTETPQGIVVVARNVLVPLERVPLRHRPLLLVLDGIGDPGNLGTLIRSAWSLGAHSVLLGEECCDPLNPKAVRATMGGLFHVPVTPVRSNADLVSFLGEKGVALLGAASGEGVPCHRADFRRPVAVAIGSEVRGLSPLLRSAAEAMVSIPEQPGAESLNAAAAGAVLLYEARRQRDGSAGHARARKPTRTPRQKGPKPHKSERRPRRPQR